MLSKEQLQKARAFFIANQLAPPYDHELEALAEILAERTPAPEQPVGKPLGVDDHGTMWMSRTSGGTYTTEQPAAASDVVEEMRKACGVVDCHWPSTEAMTAAFEVARAHYEQGRYTLNQIEAAIRAQLNKEGHTTNTFIPGVRNRLQPAPKERVTVTQYGGAEHANWVVRLDGTAMGPTFIQCEQDAERYAAGLRQEIAEKEADNGK